MIIDGRQLANQLLATLSLEVSKLRKRSIIPSLSVILIGDNPASLSYIKQKQKAAEAVGAKLVLSNQPTAISYQQLQQIIKGSNNDPAVHGIIIQRPLPPEAGGLQPLLLTVHPQKDVDGFVPGSPHLVPVAAAAEKILRAVSQQPSAISEDQKFYEWLHKQNIVIIGRGETAGKPIFDHFVKLQCTPIVITSQTPNPDALLKEATIIISCVGKERVVTPSNISKHVILVSVGIWRDREGKLHGDYEEGESRDIASFYTPTPGGVGPVNVACLMQNLVTAASNS